MANVPILKPNSTAGAVIHADSEINSTGGKKFFMKVVNFVLDASSTPIDITAEGDVAQDIRHTEVLNGRLRLVGYMTRDKIIEIDTIRSKANNKQLLMKIYVGNDKGGTPVSRYWKFKVVIQNIRAKFTRTGVGIEVIIDALITDKFDGSNVIDEATSA